MDSYYNAASQDTEGSSPFRAFQASDKFSPTFLASKGQGFGDSNTKCRSRYSQQECQSLDGSVQAPGSAGSPASFNKYPPQQQPPHLYMQRGPCKTPPDSNIKLQESSGHNGALQVSCYGESLACGGEALEAKAERDSRAWEGPPGNVGGGCLAGKTLPEQGDLAGLRSAAPSRRRAPRVSSLPAGSGAGDARGKPPFPRVPLSRDLNRSFGLRAMRSRKALALVQCGELRRNRDRNRKRKSGAPGCAMYSLQGPFSAERISGKFRRNHHFCGNGLSCLSLSPLIATPLTDFCPAADNPLASSPWVISGN